MSTVIIGICVFAAVVAAAVTLTFRLPNAQSGEVVGSTAEWLWPWILGAVASFWAITVITDFLAARACRVRKVTRTGNGWHAALPCVAAATCILRATHQSGQAYVPPATWPLILAVAVAAYAVAALLHVATPRGAKEPSSRRARWRWAAATVGCATIAAAWYAPSIYRGPSNEQLTIDAATLRAVVPMHGCRSGSVQGESALIMRDLVRSAVLCKQGNLSGRFIWFRTRGMMHVYASARAQEADTAFTGEDCTSGSPFLGNWHEDAEPSASVGQLMCIPHPGVIGWENDRVDVYGIIRARDPIEQLYHWWEHHDNYPGLPAS